MSGKIVLLTPKLYLKTSKELIFEQLDNNFTEESSFVMIIIWSFNVPYVNILYLIRIMFFE